MRTRFLFVCLAAALAACNSGGGTAKAPPALDLVPLQSCTKLRTIDLASILAALQEELASGIPDLPIELDLDDDGTTDVTISGSVAGNTATWNLAGAVTGSGSFDFQLGVTSVTLTGSGTISAGQDCTLAFTFPDNAPLVASANFPAQPFGGSIDFRVTAGGETLEGTLVLTHGSGQVLATNLRVGEIEPADFTFQIPVGGVEPPPPPGASGVVFSEFTAFNDTDIWTIEVDGSGARKILDTSSIDHDPVWSPDGSKIAFLRDVTTQRPDLFRMDADGTNVERITFFADETASPGHGINSPPAWSPDGTEIAITVRERLVGGDRWAAHIVDMTLPGAAPEEVTRGENSVQVFAFPSFSADGTLLALSSFSDGNIYVIGASARGAPAPNPLSVIGDQAIWSPVPGDNRILYIGNDHGPDGIWIADLSDLDNIVGMTLAASQGADAKLPAWSPDGTRALYQAVDRDPAGFTQSLWVKDLDSGDETEISPGHNAISRASWIAADR